jgi:hypothetical protein
MTNPVHELTVDIAPDLYDTTLWRLSATCSCLGFARGGLAATRAACEAGALTIDRQHMLHMAHVAAGWQQVPGRPDWLDQT